MSKKLTPIQLKRANQAAKDAALAQSLAAQRKAQKAADTGAKKRKDVEFLLGYLAVSPLDALRLRDADTYIVKTYNLGRQVQGLVDHMFVKYPVPLFLYRPVLTPAGRAVVLQDDDKRTRTAAWERDLFFVAAQGGSVAKVLKDKLTKKEAHWFLQAPMTNTVRQNLFWAKCAAAGVPLKGCQFLVERFSAGDVVAKLGDRLQDVLRFYANEFDKMTDYTRGEVTDYVRMIADDPTFSFKGRTLGSMLKLSNAWHLTGVGGRIGRYQSWPGLFAFWEKKLKSGLVRAVELTNNRTLAEEGRKQRHCVYTYTHSCLENWSRIVSLRWVEASVDGDKIVKRVTVEVSPREKAIVQVRGAANRSPDEEEVKILREWAGTMGLTIARL